MKSKKFFPVSIYSYTHNKVLSISLFIFFQFSVDLKIFVKLANWLISFSLVYGSIFMFKEATKIITKQRRRKRRWRKKSKLCKTNDNECPAHALYHISMVCQFSSVLNMFNGNFPKPKKPPSYLNSSFLIVSIVISIVSLEI